MTVWASMHPASRWPVRREVVSSLAPGPRDELSSTIMRLGLLTAVLVFWFSAAARAQDAGECFSPTQHADTALHAEAGTGCPCDPAVDADVCVNGTGFFCEGERWSARYECYGPPRQDDDGEPASWCAMSPARGSRRGTLVAFVGLAVAALLRRRPSCGTRSRCCRG